MNPLGQIGLRPSEKSRDGHDDESASDDQRAFKKMLRFELGDLLADRPVQIHANGHDHERENKDQIGAIHCDGNPHAETEEIGMGHHGKNQGALGVDPE